MRLRDIYVKCYEEIKIFNEYSLRLRACLPRDGKISASDTLKFCNIYETCYEHGMRELNNIPYLSETLSQMHNSIIEPGKTVDYKMQLFEELYRRMLCIISLYSVMIAENEESIGLDIKLPETNNITDLKNHIDNLEFVFTKCPFFQNNDASLQLKAVENGSIWLIFGVTCVSLVTGSVFLNNIAAFIDKCIVIMSHIATYKRQKQEIEESDLEQKEKEEILKSINKLHKVVVKNAVKELEENTGCHLQDGDERGRVEQAFNKMIKLLEQGLQIYSSVNSPKEIKAVFAPLEMHYLSIGKKKEQIEKKIDVDTE